MFSGGPSTLVPFHVSLDSLVVLYSWSVSRRRSVPKDVESNGLGGGGGGRGMWGRLTRVRRGDSVPRDTDPTDSVLETVTTGSNRTVH